MNRLQQIFQYLLLAPAVLPLAICNGLYFPFLFPKVMAFYAIALITLAVFAYLVSHREKFYFARLDKKITWIPAALLVLAYVTSIFGIDFYKSFWSIFGRGDGLLQMTLSVASFYLILISADNVFFQRFIRSVAAVSSIVVVWGIVEWFTTGGRISSSIGNPAFLAGYLALSFFITLVAASGAPTHAWRRLAYLGAVLELIAIILTATRGTILALLITGIIYLVYLAFFNKNGYSRKVSVAVLLTLIAICTLFFVFRSSLADSSFTPVARIAQISTNDPDIANRLFVWGNLFEEIKKKPIFGYGAENVSYLFDKFYDPGVINEDWFDRSHNAYLDYAVQYGVFGVVLFLWLILILIASGLNYAKKNGSIGVLFSLAAITYAIQNFFVFDTISSWWLFIALLAVLLAQNIETKQDSLPIFIPPIVGSGIAIAFIALIIPTSILPVVANYDLARGYYYHIIDVSRANSYFNKGLALNTFGNLEYGYQLHNMYTEQQASRLSGDDRVMAYEMAKEVLTRNYERYQYDARTAVYLASVLDAAPPDVPADPEFVRAVVTRALSQSPKRAQTWYVLANLSIGPAKDLPVGAEKTARYKEAIGILRGYVSIVPKLAEPHFVLAELYFALGDIVQAKSEAAIGDASYKKDLETARRAALLYERLQDWQRAEVYLQRVVDEDETDMVFYYDLAKVKYMLGDYNGALTIVQDLRTHNSEILTTDQNFTRAITEYENSTK